MGGREGGIVCKRRRLELNGTFNKYIMAIVSYVIVGKIGDLIRGVKLPLE